MIWEYALIGIFILVTSFFLYRYFGEVFVAYLKVSFKVFLIIGIIVVVVIAGLGLLKTFRGIDVMAQISHFLGRLLN